MQSNPARQRLHTKPSNTHPPSRSLSPIPLNSPTYPCFAWTSAHASSSRYSRIPTPSMPIPIPHSDPRPASLSHQHSLHSNLRYPMAQISRPPCSVQNLRALGYVLGHSLSATAFCQPAFNALSSLCTACTLNI